jgi:ADP-ribose pyrophosphatase
MKPKLSPPIRVHQNPFMNVDHVGADFGAFRKDYYVVEFGPRAGIIAVHEGRILLVRQYRLLPNALCWEIPGGCVEKEEDSATAALRECQEEAGVACAELQPILVYYPGLDNVQNRTTLYLAKVMEIAAFQPKASEIVERGWFSPEQALKMVFEGTIQDAMSVAGILSYSHRDLITENQGQKD